MDEEYVTVSDLNDYLKRKFSTDQNLKKVYLKGEISNFKGVNRGNYYFTLKDDKSQISATLFAGHAKKVKFNIENGLKVLVRGFVGIYPNYGKYQIYINKMTEDGLGDLHVAYEQLKKKLKAEGLFDSEIKKPIPKFPKKIGVITSSTGAAIKDIVRTIERRWPLCEILIFPSLVQGSKASLNIVNQIKFSENFNLDTLIIGRGGGSIEDLWCFNDENVARAIYESKTPIISAIGHDTDYTIADFVADKIALTPTDAGNIAVPDINIVKNQLDELNRKIQSLINNQIKSYNQKLDSLTNRSIFSNPDRIYQNQEITLDNLIKDLEIFTSKLINSNESRLNQIKNAYGLKNPYIITDKKSDKVKQSINKLELLNPLLTLKRGYTLAKIDGKVVSKSKDLKKGDQVDIEFSDGLVNTEVIK